MTSRRLVADTGGTNVRFAVADANGNLDRVKVFQTADFPTFTDALAAYRTDAGGLNEIDASAIAAAGPVEGNAVKLTNNEWTVDGAAIAALLGVPVVVLNDLEAVAAALPHLRRPDHARSGRAGSSGAAHDDRGQCRHRLRRGERHLARRPLVHLSE
jgi:glucokinase